MGCGRLNPLSETNPTSVPRSLRTSRRSRRRTFERSSRSLRRRLKRTCPHLASRANCEYQAGREYFPKLGSATPPARPRYRYSTGRRTHRSDRSGGLDRHATSFSIFRHSGPGPFGRQSLHAGHTRWFVARPPVRSGPQCPRSPDKPDIRNRKRGGILFDRNNDIPGQEHCSFWTIKGSECSRSVTYCLTQHWNSHIVTVRECQTLMRYTARDIGKTVRDARKKLGVTQRDLALTSGTGLRFIIELERGKPTCQLEKTLTVLNTLGIQVELTPPATVN